MDKREKQKLARKRYQENHPERHRILNLQRVKRHYQKIKDDPIFKEKRREYAKQYRETNGVRQRPKISKEPIVIFKGPITISFK